MSLSGLGRYAVLAIAVVGLTACGPAETLPDGGSDGITLQKDIGIIVVDVPVGSPDADADGTSGPLCEAGKRGCVDSTSWAQCAFSGLAYGDKHVCAAGTLCDPDLGACRPSLCTPESVECTGLLRIKSCKEAGFGWEDPTYCTFGETCEADTCRVCEPLGFYCVDAQTSAQCDTEGSGPFDQVTCGDGYACSEKSGKCAPIVCNPGTTVCESRVSYRDCLPSGTGYDTWERPCAPEFLCVGASGTCIYKKCLPFVLLLVDRSGSMQPHWGAVRSAVKTMVAENPTALFGLIPFPVSGSCGTTSSPTLAPDFHSASTLDAWFDANLPNGATPLAEAVAQVGYGGGFTYGNFGGSLVVLSDGQDTCYGNTSPVNALTQATETLKLGFNVKSYVIGFNYSGDPGQLNAIAAAGGTELTSYIPAGSEATLSDAFRSVIDDIKLCLAPK